MRSRWRHIPQAYVSKAVLGCTDGPWPVVSPGSVLPALSLGAGYAADAGYGPEAILGQNILLGAGIGLDVAPGEAVSAGPVWDVSRYLLTDASVYLTAPAVSLSGAHEWVVCWERDTAVASHWLAFADQSADAFAMFYIDASRLRGCVGNSSVVRDVQIAGSFTGQHVSHLVVTESAPNLVANLAQDGGAVTTNVAGMSVALPTPTLKLGRYTTSAAAGLKIRWVGLRAAGVLSAGSRTAINGAQLSDPRDLSSEAFTRLYAMGNVYDSGGGVWMVKDLITTDGTTDATVVGGDNTDFVAV